MKRMLGKSYLILVIRNKIERSPRRKRKIRVRGSFMMAGKKDVTVNILLVIVTRILLRCMLFRKIVKKWKTLEVII